LAPFQIGEVIEVEILSLSYGGGRGVARFRDFVIFIPFTAPGDRARVEILKIAKSFAEGKLLDLIEKSPHRVSPPCPVYGKCGGCCFQHVSAEEQLRQKNAYIQRSLSKLSVGQLDSIVPSPRDFHYRNRIQVHVRGKQLGFVRPRTNDLVPITQCKIAEESIDQALSEEASRSQIFGLSEKKVEVALSREGSLQIFPVSTVGSERHFAQVNRFQNENLVNLVKEWAQAQELPKEVWDLYAGSGNLSFPLAEGLSAQVTAVELSRPLVKAAQSQRPLKNLNWICSDVADFVRQQKSLVRSNSLLVVTDPPREGLRNSVIDDLCELRPSRWIHIGCDLMSFSRDLQKLSQRGFQIDRVTPLDMFPQTDHVEMMALISYGA
tara:strand:- start:26445 stop:27581 length:1137 start_codon:yes stop_codon:yes gene_type:complete